MVILGQCLVVFCMKQLRQTSFFLFANKCRNLDLIFKILADRDKFTLFFLALCFMLSIILIAVLFNLFLIFMPTSIIFIPSLDALNNFLAVPPFIAALQSFFIFSSFLHNYDILIVSCLFTILKFHYYILQRSTSARHFITQFFLFILNFRMFYKIISI